MKTARNTKQKAKAKKKRKEKKMKKSWLYLDLHLVTSRVCVQCSCNIHYLVPGVGYVMTVEPSSLLGCPFLIHVITRYYYLTTAMSVFFCSINIYEIV